MLPSLPSQQWIDRFDGFDGLSLCNDAAGRSVKYGRGQKVLRQKFENPKAPSQASQDKAGDEYDSDQAAESHIRP
jgi:hypothetical protein